LDRKKYDEYLPPEQQSLEVEEVDSSLTSETFLPITQHKQFSPSIYFSEGKFIMNITLKVDDRPFNVQFDLAADQVANLNAQCAKALVPYVFYDLRKRVSE
jgi:hypothetical protein